MKGTNNKIKSIDYVRSVFSNKGYKLLDVEYKGSLFKYTGESEEGYFIFSQYGNLLANGKAKIFYKTNPYTIQNIHTWLKINNVDLKLLSDNYVDACEDLEWTDRNETLPSFFTPWRSILDGSRHPLKSHDTTRHSKEFITATIKEKLKYWEIIDSENFEYKNVFQKIRLKNKQNYISEMSISSILNDRKPLIFSSRYPEISLQNLKNWLKINTSYTLKDKQTYIGNKEKYILICSKHGEFEIPLNHLLSGATKCYQCKTEENRMKKNIKIGRGSPEYKKWRMEIFERDEYTCQYCGQIGYKLNAHHLYSYKQYKKLRLEISNGITLCQECHNNFHSRYGKINNTDEQYREWICSKEK
jgi:hypothetical protein